MQLSNKPGLASKVYDVEDFSAAQELYHSSGWTDGLPVVPPTKSAVEACLDWAGLTPDQLIGIEPVREQPITAEKLAINAVMAGCLPIHFPVVATAWAALSSSTPISESPMCAIFPSRWRSANRPTWSSS